MAISSLNYTQAGVETILGMSSIAVNEFTQSALTGTHVLNELKADIRALQDREQALLARFGGLEELKARIARFKADAQRFAGKGLGLNLTFAYEAANKESLAKAQSEFEYYIVQSMQKFLPESARNNLTGEDLFNYLNLADLGLSSMEMTITEKGSTIKTNKKVKGGQVGGKQANVLLSEFLLHKASSGVQERVRKAVEQIKKDMNVEGEANFHINQNHLLIGAKWHAETQGLTESKAKKDPYIKENLGDINRRIAEEIEKMLGISNYSNIYWRIMGQMLTQNPYMFFVGGNIHQLTGLIGEITAMILFYDLVGEFPSLEWAAQNTGLSGTQASADIIIDAGFGIQVKNSTTDFGLIEDSAQALTIGFSDVSFDRLGDILHFNSEGIEDLYDTKTYNPAYTWGNGSGTFGEGSNSKFDGTAKRIDTLIKQFELLMTMYSSSLLYMEDARNKNLNVYSGDIGNVLYMVNLVPYLASDMLQKIVDALEGQGSNPLSFSLSKEETMSDGTIIEDINPDPHAFFSMAGTEMYGPRTKNRRYFSTSYTFTR